MHLRASECICVHLIGLVIGFMVGLMVGLALVLTMAGTWTTSMTRGARCGLSGNRCARMGWDRAPLTLPCMQVLTTALKPHRYWDRRFPRMLSDDQVMASDCMLIAFLISSPMTR